MILFFFLRKKKLKGFKNSYKKKKFLFEFILVTQDVNKKKKFIILI